MPVIGYEQATDIAKTALATGRGVYDLVCDRGLMTRDALDQVLNPSAMTGTPSAGVPEVVVREIGSTPDAPSR